MSQKPWSQPYRVSSVSTPLAKMSGKNLTMPENPCKSVTETLQKPHKDLAKTHQSWSLSTRLCGR
jgi:hypothetical protein